MRGNRRRPTATDESRGSIPACAGEPGAGAGGQQNGKVYPRVCGGTFRRGMRTVSMRGLSPRVRGNLIRQALAYQPVGSIPACAGEPASGGGTTASITVYPRVCGGTAEKKVNRCPNRGLSPRVRGNRRCSCPLRCHSRSIPACAGEPRFRLPGCAAVTVYPRVCGGTQQSSRRNRMRWGLSPRVRGNRVFGCPVAPP